MVIYNCLSTYLAKLSGFWLWAFPPRLVAAVCIVGPIFVYLSIRWQMKRVRLYDDNAIELKAKTRFANRMRQDNGNMVSMLPPYPTGWFGIELSTKLPVGSVQPVDAFGKTLLMFRGNSGEAFCTDAFCPHLGADMAQGGKVVENCIQCPFHGWKFRGYDGRCVEIPYGVDTKIPTAAQINSYPTHEVNGVIFVWHDEDGRDPLWSVPGLAIEQLPIKAESLHIVCCHIQEIAENGGDLAHLSVVHGFTARSHCAVLNIGRHHWVYNWAVDSGTKQFANFTIEHHFRLFNRLNLPLLSARVEGMQIGPGVVYLHMFTRIGEIWITQLVVPVAPFRQRVVHFLSASSWMPNFLAAFFLYAENIQFERDMIIWNSKRFVKRPVLARNKIDQLLGRWRSWYGQFYPSTRSTEKDVDF